MITIVRVQAQKKAATSNLSNLEFVLLDEETAEFPEGTFDRLLCLSGMLYLQHIGAAVHRFRSWLKPCGQFTSTPHRQVPIADHIKCRCRSLQT